MSSGIGIQELVLLFVIGLLILGPERLPRVATQIGRWVGRARRTANQLRYQLEREIALADIDKSKKDVKRKPDAATPGDAEPEDSSRDQSGAASEPLGEETIARPAEGQAADNDDPVAAGATDTGAETGAAVGGEPKDDATDRA
jgi:sec-independent protein translocase protein TatB